LIFNRAVQEQFAQPLTEAAAGNAEYSAQRYRLVLATLIVDESVLYSGS
jgi:hypothetical protein